MKQVNSETFLREFFTLSIALVIVLSITLPQIFPHSETVFLDTSDSSGISALSAAAEAGYAYLRIETENGLQLSHVYLLINGVSCADLSDGSRTLRVSPGDVIEIDGTLYDRSIPFRVTSLSSRLDSSYINARPVTNGDITRAAVIVSR